MKKCTNLGVYINEKEECKGRLNKLWMNVRSGQYE